MQQKFGQIERTPKLIGILVTEILDKIMYVFRSTTPSSITKIFPSRKKPENQE